MKISPCIYNDAGELMAPRELDVKLTTTVPGGRPSLEAGFYHAFAFVGKTERERDQKRQRFIEEMAAIPRSMILSADEYTVKMDSFVRHGLKLIYVIETAEGASTPQDPHWWLNRYSPSVSNELPSRAN